MSGDANFPYQVPAPDELPARLDSVLRVIYPVFNEGYSASSGDSLTRHDLAREAIRLAHAARADLCRRLGKYADAQDAYQRALELTRQAPERRFIERRLAELKN